MRVVLAHPAPTLDRLPLEHSPTCPAASRNPHASGQRLYRRTRILLRQPRRAPLLLYGKRDIVRLGSHRSARCSAFPASCCWPRASGHRRSAGYWRFPAPSHSSPPSSSAIVYGLRPDEKWDAQFNPQTPAAQPFGLDGDFRGDVFTVHRRNVAHDRLAVVVPDLFRIAGSGGQGAVSIALATATGNWQLQRAAAPDTQTPRHPDTQTPRHPK